MATFSVHRVTALPDPLVASAIYVVAPPAKPDYVELYVTGNTASAKRLLTGDDIQAMIDTSLAGIGAIEVVADIAARDALALAENGTVMVLDASADPTVASGAATYVYQQSVDTWHKISEAESLDLSVAWSAIADGPASTGPQVDAAVAASHSHANKTQLDLVGVDGGGELTYNGNNIAPRLSTGDW